jgi:hypothetical protein
MKLRIIVVALLTVGAGLAQDPCSQWQRTPAFKSKADCEETAKISDEWNGFCAKAHEKAGLWPENLSVADRAGHEFCEITDSKDTTSAVLASHKDNQKVQEFWKSLRSEVLSHWEDTRDVFCMFHPSAVYVVEGDHIGAHCPADDQYTGVPDRKAMDKLFDEDETLSFNIMTFSSSLRCDDITDPNEQKTCMQRLVDASKPLIDALKKQQK